MMRVTALAALLAAVPAAEAAQPIGRLFFTPAERAQLDVARANKRVAEPPAASGKRAEPPKPQTQIITYNGIVRRSDGKSILWLNSHAADEKEALSGLPVAGRVRPDGRVTLQVPNGGGTISLKVGQSAELETGRVREAPPPETAPTAKAEPKGDKGAEKADKADKSDKGAAAAKPAEAEKKTDATPKAAEPEQRTLAR
jgi:hypothetical protein